MESLTEASVKQILEAAGYELETFEVLPPTRFKVKLRGPSSLPQVELKAIENLFPKFNVELYKPKS